LPPETQLEGWHAPRRENCTLRLTDAISTPGSAEVTSLLSAMDAAVPTHSSAVLFCLLACHPVSLLVLLLFSQTSKHQVYVYYHNWLYIESWILLMIPMTIKMWSTVHWTRFKLWKKLIKICSWLLG